MEEDDYAAVNVSHSVFGFYRSRFLTRSQLCPFLEPI